MPKWLHVDMYHYSICQLVFRSLYVVFIMWMMDYLYWSIYFLNDSMLIKIQIPYMTVQRDSALNEEIWSQWILRIVTESICCDSKCFVPASEKIVIEFEKLIMTEHGNDYSCWWKSLHINLRFQLLDPRLVAEYFVHSENYTAVCQSQNIIITKKIQSKLM